MKLKLVVIALAMIWASAYVRLSADDEMNGSSTLRAIILAQTKSPKPNRFIDEPEAWFDHGTGMIYIYLDTSAYNEYTLYLTAPTGTSTVYPTTSVVAIPADLARRLTYMLIDSEDVGAYEASVSINTGTE